MTRFLDNLIARVDDRRRPDQFSPRRRLIDVSVETATIDKGDRKKLSQLVTNAKKSLEQKKKWWPPILFSVKTFKTAESTQPEEKIGRG